MYFKCFLFLTDFLVLNIFFPPAGNATSALVPFSHFGELKGETDTVDQYVYVLP